jgi:ATP-dependent DNA helicase RecG
MTQEEVKALIAGGEGLHVDFKQSVNTDLAKSISSFANAQGGKVIIGVADDGSVVGYNLTNANRSRIQDVAQSCDPPVSIGIEQVAYQEGKNITMVDVPASAAKPHRCTSGFYLRQGSSSIKMSTNEILDFVQAHGRVHFDETVRTDLIVSQIFSSELIDRFRNFLPPEVASIGVLDLLASLKAAEGDHPTNTGILFFTPNPSKYITDATVKCVSYKGTNKVDVLDNYPLIERDLITTIEECMLFFRKSLKMARIVDGVAARDELEVPEVALREALVNALIHRDYLIRGGRVMVEVYDDRVEISSPGSLPQGLSEADFGTRSLTRNPNIADLLLRTPYMERLGTGIQRIKMAVEKAGLPAPRFSIGSHFGLVISRVSEAKSGPISGPLNDLELTDKQIDMAAGVLFGLLNGPLSGPLTEVLNANDIEVIRLLQKGTYNTAQLADHMQKPATTVKKYVGKLNKMNCIVYEGPKKTGGYILTKAYKEQLEKIAMQ